MDYRIRQLIEEALDEETSAERLDELSIHDSRSVRHCVASHPRTKQFTLQRMLDDKDISVLGCLARNENISQEILDFLFNLSGENGYVLVADALAKNPITKPHMLESLSKIKDEYVRHHVGSHPNTPPYILMRYAKIKKAFICSGVAENKNLPSEVAWELTKCKDVSTLAKLARNPNAPPDVLDFLAEHKQSDFGILSGVASNKNTNIATIENIAKTAKGSLMSQALAKNPNTPFSILMSLSKHEETYVRLELAKNPSIPIDIVKALLLDSDDLVRETVLKNPAAKSFACFV
jgi:hypothetical protein